MIGIKGRFDWSIEPERVILVLSCSGCGQVNSKPN